MIELRSGPARATIVPEMGAGLGGLWFDDKPALRPWSGRAEDGPFALALNLLAPFSNRISGGFDHDGIRYDLAPNLPGEPYPIHGDAFQRPWQVTEASASRARLILGDGSFGPFRYLASVEYRLSDSGMHIVLDLTSTSAVALPFGAGFHPWFPRSPATRLEFRARGVWPEDHRHLPASPSPRPVAPGSQGNGATELPHGWINQGYADWDGHAAIRQGGDAASIDLGAPGLATVILYSPSGTANFFCFEPVSHPVDAHNLPSRPGLKVLAPGESLSVDLAINSGCLHEDPVQIQASDDRFNHPGRDAP